MTSRSSNIFIIFTIYLSFIFHRSNGFEVIQPENRTVNPDGSASISCEHTANVNSVKDVRLNVISLTDKPRLLCQKGMKDCKNVSMHQENPQKWLFIMLNIGPEAMTKKYQCEVTVKTNDLHHTKTGTPTKLLAGQKEAACFLQPSPPPCPQPPQPPQPPPCPQFPQLFWIVIGLLALMFLYSCVITSFFIRLRCRNREARNSTYVEMRKAPQPRNPAF